MEEIFLPSYAPVLMESTRTLGYSVESAIVDLLHDSISANAANIGSGYGPWADPCLSILDNGQGVLPDKMTAAMRVLNLCRIWLKETKFCRLVAFLNKS